MAIDPKKYEGISMAEYVEIAVAAMAESLSEKDWGIVGSIRTMAEYCDETRQTCRALDLDGNAEPKDRIRAMELHNKAVYTIPHIMSGLEKLGGSVAARKAIGVKEEKPKSGLAAVREMRPTGTSGAAEAKKPAARRKKSS